MYLLKKVLKDTYINICNSIQIRKKRKIFETEEFLRIQNMIKYKNNQIIRFDCIKTVSCFHSHFYHSINNNII